MQRTRRSGFWPPLTPSKVKAESEAESEGIKFKGDAEAAVIKAKSDVEADVMARKASAFAEYGEASRVEMVLHALPKVRMKEHENRLTRNIVPQVAAEVAGSLSQCNKVVMVSQGEGEIGASKLTNEVMDIVSKINTMAQGFTGRTASLAAVSIWLSSKCSEYYFWYEHPQPPVPAVGGAFSRR